jgi:serine/threonine protein kinase
VKPAAEPVTPDQFGPYEVYERLGIGGMAQVHRAKKRGVAGFERSVALKRMLSHLAEDRSFVESFIREAKVVSVLVHPNNAQVYDIGRIGGIYYIAMELVAGFDLRKLLRYANRANEPISLPVVLSILGELCDALEYAHNCVDEQGTALNIVHRDISPSNMIVAHTGHIKVIDFGIAKA